MKLRVRWSSWRWGAVGLTAPDLGPMASKKSDLDSERMGERIEAADANEVDACLVFVHLLVGGTDQFGQLCHREAQHDPPLANLLTHMPVDSLGSVPG